MPFHSFISCHLQSCQISSFHMMSFLIMSCVFLNQFFDCELRKRSQKCLFSVGSREFLNSPSWFFLISGLFFLFFLFLHIAHSSLDIPGLILGIAQSVLGIARGNILCFRLDLKLGLDLKLYFYVISPFQGVSVIYIPMLFSHSAISARGQVASLDVIFFNHILSAYCILGLTFQLNAKHFTLMSCIVDPERNLGSRSRASRKQTAKECVMKESCLLLTYLYGSIYNYSNLVEKEI